MEGVKMSNWDQWAQQVDKNQKESNAEINAKRNWAASERESIKTYAPERWEQLVKAFEDGCKALNKTPRLSGHRFSVRSHIFGEITIGSMWMANQLKVR
jgi:hypothetical protein